MSYMRIENLYANQAILAFRECYAMEKIHGTSAHVEWKDDHVLYSSGGAKRETFLEYFAGLGVDLAAGFAALGHPAVTVYGEAYGGKVQAMSGTYGKVLKFVAFEVRVGDVWLAVPQAEDVVMKLGLEFVSYAKVSTDLESLDRERGMPSVQAKRNGIAEDKPREGIVLRPIFECRLNSGDRIIAKHKGDAFKETQTKRAVVNPDKQVVLAEAEAIAFEWVTPMRLTHVLDAFPGAGIEKCGEVIKAMVADVEREAGAEIITSREARKAIGSMVAKLFQERLKAELGRPPAP